MENKKILIVQIIIGAVLLTGLIFSLNLTNSRIKGLENDLTKFEHIESELTNLWDYTAPYIYTGEPITYVLEFENDTKFFFGADTGIMADMKLVIGDYYKPDVAFLPVGNYYTMDYKGAAYAASLINPSSYIVPNHYASFPMLEQTPENFFNEIGKYNLKAEPLEFKMGEKQDLLGVETLWLGHGNWFFKSPENTRILIDPEITWNINYPTEWQNLEDFEEINLILLTHGHFDHTTIEDLSRWVEMYNPIIIAPFELGVWIKKYINAPVLSINKGANIGKEEMLAFGLPEEKVAKIADGLRIHMTSAAHSSSATPVGEDPSF